MSTRKATVMSTVALSFVALGAIAPALPASAAPSHHSVRAAGEDDDSSDDTVPRSAAVGGGGAGAPVGGAATGAGGMAVDETKTATPWVVTGGAGLAFLGSGALLRRRRTVEA
jgi:hypothetical protein